MFIISAFLLYILDCMCYNLSVFGGIIILILFNGDYKKYVLPRIAGAVKSVYVSQFKFEPVGVSEIDSVGCLLNALVKKHKEGLDVKVLLNYAVGVRGWHALNRFVFQKLYEAGVDVRYLGGSRIVHAKILVVDGETAVIGSHNWCRNSLTRNFECSVVLPDIQGAEYVRSFFCEVFAGAKKYVPVKA